VSIAAELVQVRRDQRPDAVVLIDYPGFNWWIARAAKRNGIPVFYYGVPHLRASWWAFGESDSARKPRSYSGSRR
jgi:lipid-A-disaccharide synthase